MSATTQIDARTVRTAFSRLNDNLYPLLGSATQPGQPNQPDSQVAGQPNRLGPQLDQRVARVMWDDVATLVTAVTDDSMTEFQFRHSGLVVTAMGFLVPELAREAEVADPDLDSLKRHVEVLEAAFEAVLLYEREENGPTLFSFAVTIGAAKEILAQNNDDDLIR